MAKIKQLKDKSGTEQIFPKTKTQAIYNTDGTLLSETLDDLYGSLATIESSPTTTSHSVGEYILYQGQVYKVTSVIASGDTLVVGTNISAVNLGDQISALNSNLTVTEEYLPFTYGNKTVNIYFRKYGKMITVLMTKDNESMSLPTSWTAVGSLTNIKPPSDRYVPFVSSNGYTGTIRIYADGGVRIIGHSSNAMWLQCSATTML